MSLKKFLTRKTITALILIVIALVSVFGISKIASSPKFHQHSIETLDKKKVTVMEITAAAAASSVAVSAIPGDSTSAIANQIASLSLYSLIIVGAIILEKILLTLTGYLTFSFIIPISCLLAVIQTFKPSHLLKTISIKLAVFGLTLFLVVPTSIQISELIEKTFEIQKTASQTENATEEISENNSKENEEDKTIISWLSELGDSIKNNVNKAINKAEDIMNNLIDSIAVLLITSCVIPILVLLTFFWLIKIMFGFDIKSAANKSGISTQVKGSFISSKLI